MNVYFVNKTPLPDGRHEIHRANYTYLPLPGHRIYLGVFSTCQQAISEAKKVLLSAYWLPRLFSCMC